MTVSPFLLAGKSELKTNITESLGASLKDPIPQTKPSQGTDRACLSEDRRRKGMSDYEQDDDVTMSCRQDGDDSEYEYISNESDVEYTYEDYDDDDEMSAGGAGSKNDAGSPSGGKLSPFSTPGSGKKSGEYRILGTEMLTKRKDYAVNQVVELLCLQYDEAQILLRHYNWDHGRLETEWFNDEGRVRDVAGLPLPADQQRLGVTKANGSNNSSQLGKRGRTSRGSNPQSAPPGDGQKSNGKIFCLICLSDYPDSGMAALDCGHKFCTECWQAHIDVAVQGGPSCTELACPAAQCTARVPESMIKALGAEKVSKRWNSFMIRSFVDQNRSARWCPRPGCEYAVEYPGGGAIDVCCPCGPFLFCFGCGLESHRPATCLDAKRWQEKNSAESENVTWIMANTKQCPKCGVNIEKNQGCNHMSCRKQTGGCGHEFCWLCLGDWKEHGANTGGYYNCNKYENVKKKDKKLAASEARREAAKHELDRYMHYFERYNNHNRARKYADKTLEEIKRKRAELHDKKGFRIEETDFMLEAAKCIIDSRRVLEWTYVFGYYLENESERPLFQNLQEMLEKFTESLHELVEQPLDRFIHTEACTRGPFEKHRAQITNLLSSTERYKMNLLEGIDAGLTSNF